MRKDVEKLIELVYLDHYQCETFGVGYFESSQLNISCRELRESKDYDAGHKKLFDTYPNCIFHLTREEGDRPGWYKWSLL